MKRRPFVRHAFTPPPSAPDPMTAALVAFLFAELVGSGDGHARDIVGQVKHPVRMTAFLRPDGTLRHGHVAPGPLLGVNR